MRLSPVRAVYVALCLASPTVDRAAKLPPLKIKLSNLVSMMMISYHGAVLAFRIKWRWRQIE